MAESEVQTPIRYFNFVIEYKNNVVEFYVRQRERTSKAMGKIYEFLRPVINFFAFFHTLFCSVIFAVKQVFATIDSTVSCIVRFHYKEFFISLSQRPKEYCSKAKTRLYQVICIPLRRRIIKLKRLARKKFLDARVYFRGFREICRRLFLLASDYTPGGQWTVSLVLLLAAIFITIQVYRYSRLLFQLLDLILSMIKFVLTPVMWTLQDLLKLAGFGLDLVLSLLKYICYLLWLFFRGVFDFIFRVFASFSSRIYRSFLWFLNLRAVKFIWRCILELTLIGLELFVFKVLPFLAVISTYLINFGTVLSGYFYDYFVDVYDDETHHEYWGNTRIFAAVLTSLSFLLAYRYRKRFSVKANLDKDTGSSLRRNMRKTLRGGSSEKEDDEVNFKVSSTAHVCMDFLHGECAQGRRCSNHHCPWPYHWQYRVPVQGWQSFNPQDVDVIEKLFCDPINELAKTSDINPDLSAITRRSHVKTNKSIKLDFQHMRMEVNYHRLEIRRLSTESSAKISDELATNWVWYRLTDEGKWAQYGSKGEPKEQDIEVTFLGRESSYNYNVQGQEYRIYFFMTPMYERNMNPRDYKRRFVRRRPLYRSLEDL